MKNSPPGFVSLSFASNDDAQRALGLCRLHQPFHDVSMPDPNTLVIHSDDFEWLSTKIADVKFAMRPAKTFADLSPEQAARRRKRGLRSGTDFATENFEALQKEIVDRIHRVTK